MDEKEKIIESLRDWIYHTDETRKEITFGTLFAGREMPDVLEVMWENFREYQKLFARYVVASGLFQNQMSGQKSRRIALFFYRYRQEGVSRVLSLLVPLYLKAGYEIILITEEHPMPDDRRLPSAVKRYVLPARLDVEEGRAKCGERERKLEEILQREKIDTVCYHAASNSLLFYDMLLAKSHGIKFIITKHELFSQGIAHNDNLAAKELNVYPIADALTVLSREEELFWRTLGVDSIFIPNPMPEMVKDVPAYDEETKHIIWVGRIDRIQKQYHHLVPVMSEVVKKMPGCILDIYGSSWFRRDILFLEKQIRDARMEENIKYHGYCKDVKEIYGNAGVLLVTSAYESFPMVIYEAMAAGIPVITYSMPYLELLKGGNGFLAVEQGDIRGAAETIIHVLSDKKLRKELSRAAKNEMEHYKPDVMSYWNRLFSGEINFEESTSVSNTKEMYANILRTMLFHESMGAARYEDLKAKKRQTDWKLRLEEVRRIIGERGLQVALYPYGVLGKKIREYLKNGGIEVNLLVDNGKKTEAGIRFVSLNELTDEDSKKYLYIVSSNNPNLRAEIRDNIYRKISPENVYDWYLLRYPE